MLGIVKYEKCVGALGLRMLLPSKIEDFLENIWESWKIPKILLNLGIGYETAFIRPGLFDWRKSHPEAPSVYGSKLKKGIRHVWHNFASVLGARFEAGA